MTALPLVMSLGLSGQAATIYVNGLSGENLDATLSSSDAEGTTLNQVGGTGTDRGTGEVGGAGSSVRSVAINDAAVNASAYASARAGRPGYGGIAGPAADAEAEARADSLGEVRATAEAFGSSGGGALDPGQDGTDGGTAVARASGRSLDGGTVWVGTRQTAGGDGFSAQGTPGNGGAASALNTVEADTTGIINAWQEAYGGKGGSGALQAGSGGDASSVIDLTLGSGGPADYRVKAQGGDSGDTGSALGGAGGEATATVRLTSERSETTGTAEAVGGRAGQGQDGAHASALADVTGSGDVRATATATGGQGGVDGQSGGTASASAKGVSTQGGTVGVTATQIGGSGGYGSNTRGGDSILVDGVQGATTGVLNLSQFAYGGGVLPWPGNLQGRGVSSLTVVDSLAREIAASSEAGGGEGTEARVDVTSQVAETVSGTAKSTGGNSQATVRAGAGNANATATALGADVLADARAESASGDATAAATATGTEGAFSWGTDRAGDGTTARAMAYAASLAGTSTATVKAIGGFGGANFVGAAGNGADVLLENSVSAAGSRDAILEQEAVAGGAGTGRDGNGGRAVSVLTLDRSDTRSTRVTAKATGGNASNWGGQGRGGSAEARITLRSTAALVSASGWLDGGNGDGGAAGDGLAVVSVQATQGKAVASASVRSGGYGGGQPKRADALVSADGALGSEASFVLRDYESSIRPILSGSVQAASGPVHSEGHRYNGTAVTPLVLPQVTNTLSTTLIADPTGLAGTAHVVEYLSIAKGATEGGVQMHGEAFMSATSVFGQGYYLDLLETQGDFGPSGSLHLSIFTWLGSGTSFSTSFDQTFTDMASLKSWFGTGLYLGQDHGFGSDLFLSYSFTGTAPLGLAFAFADGTDVSLAPSAVPLPGSLVLLLGGLALLFLRKSKGARSSV